MKNIEKKIIVISLVILLLVIIYAVFLNLDRKFFARNKNSVETKVSSDNLNNSTDNTTSANISSQNVKTKNNDQGVPVIMYHSVNDANEPSVKSTLKISTSSFDEQMKYLKDNNYTTLTIDELYDFLINNKPVPEKSVVLTFDDGYEDNYTNVYPILKKYGFTATIFPVACLVGTDNYLTTDQLKELQNNGIDIESGTYVNSPIATLDANNQLKNLEQSKSYLDNLLNKKVKYVSYPFGSYNKTTLEEASKAGYLLGFSRDGKWTYKTDGNFKLSRVYIGPNQTEADFETRITNPNY